MYRTIALTTVLSSLVSTVACEPETPAGADAGLGTALDAGVAGAVDAGPEDTPDAGTVLDAGPVDAGPPDAGVDAGEPDAGVIDAGTPDAGMTTPVRFVVMGDTGTGSDGQYRVASAIAQMCTARGGCDFGVLCGDNIYDTGVDDVDDAQWQEKFEAPYMGISFPFYATLGNHDYGAPPVLSFLGGIGIDPRRGVAQVDYAAASPKWQMPDTIYQAVEGPVELVSLNTNAMFWADLSAVERALGFDDENDRQIALMGQWEAASTSPWRVAFGHHPYLSNGPHGNAGSYDNVIIDGLIGSGSELKTFFEDHVAGHYDVYFSGHDHSVQDMGTARGTDWVVTGAGAKYTPFEGDNATLFQHSGTGFVLVEATDTTFQMDFVVVPEIPGRISSGHHVAHTRTLTR